MTSGEVQDPGAKRATIRTAAGLLVFCAVLAVAHTWPLATAPQRLSRNSNGDALLNTWAISWVAHQLPRDPLHLFDANIFWPERRTLGYSEAMIVQGVMAMPVLALGGSPVLAFNLVLLLGFTLTGFAFGLLVYRWTGSRAAMLVAASAAAFNSHTLLRLPHLQTQHPEFIALALFGMDQVFARQRARDAVTLGLGYALQALTSIYVMMFTTWALIFAGASRLWQAERGTRARAIVLLSAAAALAGLLLFPYLWEYYRLHADQGLTRGANELRGAVWQDFLGTASRLHFWWSSRFYEAAFSRNFPGIAVLALAATAMVSGVRKDARVRMCAAAATGCLIVSFLPHVSALAPLFRLIPLFWAVRAQAHINQIVLLMLAVLAGFGVARLHKAWGGRRGFAAVAGALVVLVNAESFRAPLVYDRFDGIPDIYDALSAVPNSVVADLPLPEPRLFFVNAAAMLNSTRNWRPMLNGYSGYYPPSYVRSVEALRAFPGYDAIAYLHVHGVTHVIVHKQGLIARSGQAAFDGLSSADAFVPVANDGDVYIFKLR
jgi:hypothetical protein